jgi:Flp pilus assembly protein TadD/thiol-disulfide isomerase/thioredoxin
VPRTKDTAADRSRGPNRAYLDLSRMMRQGRSWSGRERNCAFLNTASGRFATASAAVGFDHSDDSRAVAVVDWDQDGALDLWVSNRNAPRLRFLRNTALGRGSFLALRLVGTNGVTTNRDAIGARVEVVTANPRAPRLSKTLRAGEGFLAQSSKWLHFGLGDAAGAKTVEKVVVHWPGGGSQEFRGLAVDRRYEIVQGEAEARERPRPPHASRLTASTPEPAAALETARVPLVTLLRVPKLQFLGFDGAERPLPLGQGKHVLVNLWASWCSPCIEELKDLNASAAELRAAGLEVVALATDGLGDDPSDPARAVESAMKLGLNFTAGRATRELVLRLQHLHDALLPLGRPLPLPSSFLADPQGRLAAVYKGPVAPRTVLGDLEHAALDRVERFRRAAALPGRVLEDREVEESRAVAELQTRFQFAVDLFDAGRFDDAEAQYRDLLGLKPDFAEAHLNLGLIHARRGEWEEAWRRYQGAAGIRADFAEAHFNLATAFERLGDAEKAASSYRRALQLKPHYRGAQNALGVLHAQRGRSAEAEACFQKEIEAHPDLAEAHNHLGIVLLERGETDSAAGHFRDALRLAPDLADAHNNLGVALKRQGKLAEAAAEYGEAVRLQPGFAEAHNNLGAVHLLQGDADRAEAEFLKAIESRPDFAAAKANLDRARTLRAR